MGLYERYLAIRLRRTAGDPPEHVALIITERDLLEQGAYETLERFVAWAFEYGAERVTIYVSVLDETVVDTLERELAGLSFPRPVAIRGPSDTEPAEEPIRISLGLGGKHEFATAVRRIAEDVDAGALDPAAVDESDIEERLVFGEEPDLVIKTGEERLSDFMIWQSVYSELYFTDVNWRDFRERDYIRAVQEYENRQRRFGR
ncbi:undecaprenyl diphosphate synthase family protein [Halanaeroarchaeum sulfurireducens]|uniref:Undecaprenyl diphosphate synthase n=1 Tax=Halanaeroarchaeum sulfurireducens TaxID=1604004 RepID=A0A0F7PC81_9EURY|nr:undecaprenyl diphosphate synthase family protein [Halanaeroarchaeum sulfurireducens]AKH98322.1 undecaprenyl diphosphate synthase [Halanaeroarchaeum sulfurireducens]ALG82716.1 undecaprenyl diphosphate synthase [Halanaeroarchaeum sulfurireducens]